MPPTDGQGEGFGLIDDADVRAKARELGLRLALGHGLDYRNVQAVCAIEGVAELNIGHSIVSRAISPEG